MLARKLSLVVFFALSCTRPTETKHALLDCDIHWSEVKFDSFDARYRSPLGAVPINQEITLSIQTQRDDLSSARLRLWDDRVNQERYLDLTKTASGEFDRWSVTLNTGASATILYYFFELNDAAEGCSPDKDFYVDDDTQRYGGGPGTMIDNYDDWRSFQITVYDPKAKSPAWAKGASVYQIFPDRFRDGDTTNDTKPKRRFYDDPNGAIFRSNTNDWSAPICDPRGVATPSCKGAYGQNFYGGDLKGVTAAIDEGYLHSLDAIYLNPIFRAPSNHRYDPYNWSEIEPELGTREDFIELLSVAKKHSIKIILDGVFNHVSSDSPWFDRYHQSTEDGACESTSSQYRGYFRFSSESKEPSCNGEQYQTFGGFSMLPKLNVENKALRAQIFASILGWNQQGVSGWRLDAAPEVDPGPTNDPKNLFWEQLREDLTRPMNGEGRGEVMLVGESWGDAAPGLLGTEWDSATNYRLRGALLSFLFDSCKGDGCQGDSFSDNDSNAQSFTGELKKISMTQFNRQLLSIWEDYPPEAFASMMNLLGSHDTNRVLFLLRKISGEDAALAKKKLSLAWFFLFTYPGMPTIYYGDEAGIDASGVWDGAAWQDDPYNRTTMPTNAHFDDFVKTLIQLRKEHKILREGSVAHGVVLDDERQLYGFTRALGDEVALVILNRSQQTQSVRVSAKKLGLSDGDEVLELLTKTHVRVTDLALRVEIPAMSGVILTTLK